MTINNLDKSYRNIWAVGDIHGCFNELEALLQKMKFDQHKDLLIICGDLINRGPKSWQTLEYLMNLQPSVQFVWGNHDLFFMAQLNKFNILPQYEDISDKVATEKSILFEFMKQGKLLIDMHVTGADDTMRRFLITHAGIYPHWSIQQAKEYANFAHSQLIDRLQYRQANAWLKGNEADLSNLDNDSVKVKLRKIVNGFTRMRLLDKDGQLVYNTQEASGAYSPWFQWNNHILQNNTDTYLLFGHWAALHGITNKKRIINLDTGCVWGEKLTALNLRTMQKIQQNSLLQNKQRNAQVLTA